MRRQRAAAALIAAGLTSLMPTLAGCSGEGDSISRDSMVTAINATDASLLPTAADALPAFDFDKFEDLGAQLDGVAVVVNIWSSWCGPCRTEAPVLAAAARKYRASVQFLGVDILDDRADAASFILAHGWTYPSVFDASGEIRDQLGFVGQPETLFYSAGGHLVSTWIGPIPDDEMQRQIQAIAGGAQPSSAQSAEAAGR